MERPWNAVKALLSLGHRPVAIEKYYRHLGITANRIRVTNHREWGIDAKHTSATGPRCLFCRRRLPTHKLGVCRGCYSIVSSKGRPSGEAHYAWKGGKSYDEKNLVKTPLYKRFRQAILERDNHTCTKCGETYGPFEVDHIIPLIIRPKLRFARWNARTLCESCHKSTKTYGRAALKLRKKWATGVITLWQDAE